MIHGIREIDVSEGVQVHTLYPRTAWRGRGWLYTRHSIQSYHVTPQHALTSDIGPADEQIRDRIIKELPRQCLNAISRGIDATENVLLSEDIYNETTKVGRPTGMRSHSSVALLHRHIRFRQDEYL